MYTKLPDKSTGQVLLQYASFIHVFEAIIETALGKECGIDFFVDFFEPGFVCSLKNWYSTEPLLLDII